MAAHIGYPTAEKYLEMRQHAEAGLKADPDNARLLGLLGNVLTADVLNAWNGAGQLEIDRAEAAAKKAISLDHNIPAAHHALGYVHRLHGNHQDALDSFRESIKIDPNLAKSYAQAGNEMVFLGNAKDALPLVEKAFQLSPNDPSIGVFYWVKGRAYFTLGDYPNAIRALEESVRVRPNLWYAHAWLVAAYALVNRDGEAQQALLTFRQSFSAQFDLDWIARYYKEVQYQNPTLQAASAELLNGLRIASRGLSSSYPTAERSLETRRHVETGLKADPDNARLLGLLANVLASDVLNAFNSAGKPEVDRAEAAAKKAISLDHNTPLAHFSLGYVHRLHGNHQAALDAFNESIKIDPNLAKAYAQAGNEMVFLGNPSGAIPLAEKAAQLSPDNPSISVFHWVKGRAYFTLRDYPKAIEALEESVRLRPNLWFSQAWLVAAYALVNRDAEAQRALTTFSQRFAEKSDLDWIAQYYSEVQYQNPTLQAASAELLKGLRIASQGVPSS